MDRWAEQKRAVAEAAALEVQNQSTLGLGTGTTVAYFIPAVAGRGVEVACVATSLGTEQAARALGLPVWPFELMERLDMSVDGADQVGRDLWLVKGGGGAHTREKVVAAASDRFVVIVSEDKLVESVGPPVPLEALAFGIEATMRRVSELGLVKRRNAPLTPDGNLLLDYLGEVQDPAALSREFEAIPGVVGHGLFQPSLVTEVLVGRADGTIDRLRA
jgi:ribose 5-phosphate isomerase A